jgi:hypothetical protein
VKSETSLQDVDLFSTTTPARVRTDVALIPSRGGVPLEVLYSFVSLNGSTGGGRLIAFTSARRQEGVTMVVRQLGLHLAAYCREEVLIVSPPNLQRLSALDAAQIEIVGLRAAPGVWTVPQDLPELEQSSSLRVLEDLWKTLRLRFRFVLIDCSALECSAEALTLASRVDGTVLVVRAGFTPKTEVQKAARLLAAGASPFLGSILNERTYPVPGFLYRML